jgi:heme oxygenase
LGINHSGDAAMKMKEKYVIDEKGKKTAVVLDIASYKTLLEHVEDLEDALELDEAICSTKSFRSYDEIKADLKRTGHL